MWYQLKNYPELGQFSKEDVLKVAIVLSHGSFKPTSYGYEYVLDYISGAECWTVDIRTITGKQEFHVVFFDTLGKHEFIGTMPKVLISLYNRLVTNPHRGKSLEDYARGVTKEYEYCVAVDSVDNVLPFEILERCTFLRGNANLAIIYNDSDRVDWFHHNAVQELLDSGYIIVPYHIVRTDTCGFFVNGVTVTRPNKKPILLEIDGHQTYLKPCSDMLARVRTAIETYKEGKICTE